MKSGEIVLASGSVLWWDAQSLEIQYSHMKAPTSLMKLGRVRAVSTFFFLCTLLLSLPLAGAADWVRLYSEDRRVSVEFPEDVMDRLQTQIEKTAAGDVTTNFATWTGDGIVFGASGSKVPGLAFLAGKNTIFNQTKKKLLAKANGAETGYQEIVFGGHPARILDYKSGPGASASYTAKAILLLVGKKMYTVTSVITKDTAANRALEDRMAETIQAK